MPHRIVDDLEPVQVHEQDREAVALLALPVRQRALELVAQVGAVGQAGERIVQHLVLELALHVLAHADLLRQLGGARLHPLLQFGVGVLQLRGGALAFQAAGDLVADEGEQIAFAGAVAVAAGVVLHRQQAQHAFARHQRHAQPRHRLLPDHVQLAGRLQRLELRPDRRILHVHQQRLAPADHVFADAVPHPPAFRGAAGFIHVVREVQPFAIVREQRDVEIARVQELPDDPVHRLVEPVGIGGGVRQLGDAVQRFLNAFRPLPLLHFQGERLGTLGHPPLQLLLLQLAVHGIEDVAANVGQQRLVGGGVTGPLDVALHHQHAAHRLAHQDRHAQPVEAFLADVAHRPGHLRAQLVQRAHQRAPVADAVPGQAALHHRHRDELVGVADDRVDGVDEVDEAQCVAALFVQGDVEVLRIHEPPDDGMQFSQHRVQVHAGAGHVGNLEQRRLQLLGSRQRLQRAGEVAALQHRIRHRRQQRAGAVQQRRVRMGGQQERDAAGGIARQQPHAPTAIGAVGNRVATGLQDRQQRCIRGRRQPGRHGAAGAIRHPPRHRRRRRAGLGQRVGNPFRQRRQRRRLQQCFQHRP